MPPVGFEPTISAGERPQTYALDRAASGTGIKYNYLYKITIMVNIITSILLVLCMGNTMVVCASTKHQGEAI